MNSDNERNKMIRISALEYVQKISNGEFTVQEFTSETLEHIKNVEPKLHALLHRVDKDVILKRAKDIDKRLKSNQKVGRCMGMPITIKDNICIKGNTTTCGSKMLEKFIAPYDATVISRLNAEDSIIIANTNMDEFAMGLTTEFSAFGASYNPWNTDYVPGGSSGGSAVATAAFECIASLGSDTGGSVRNPASFCSVVGYKPTYGLISRYGLVSYANSIEQIGPIARTVKDVAFLLNVITGYDENDNTTIKLKDAVDYLDGIDDSIEGLRIGIIQEMTDGEGIDPQVTRATRNAIRDMERAGAMCEEMSLDMVKYSVPSYYTITAAEAESNLARYDNLRYGYDFSLEGYEFNAYIEEARSKFGPEVARRMIVGGYVSASGHSGKYYLKAQKVQAKLTREVAEAFDTYDILISPTAPTPPFKIGEKIDDPVALFMVDLNTVTANLTGKPAISIPYTMSDNKLPIGIQMMASRLNDKLLLKAARVLEKQRSPLVEVPI